MAYGRNRYGARSSRPARWMELRYAGTCKVCGRTVPAGDTAFYDPAGRTVTCKAMACCDADGLTVQEWSGSPVSGGYRPVRSAFRVGSGHTADTIRDPGEDMADRWSEMNR